MAKKKGQKNEDISFELLDEDKNPINSKMENSEKSERNEKQNSIEKEKVEVKEEKSSLEANISSELEEYKNLLQLSRAEFDNYRKRTHTLLNNAKTDGELNVILKFLPVLDSFDKAKEIISDTNVLKGIEMIEKVLKESLENIGIKQMKSLGSKFDATFHNALSITNNDSVEDEIITQVYKDGYTYNEKVIRYAQVIINKKQ